MPTLYLNHLVDLNHILSNDNFNCLEISFKLI